MLLSELIRAECDHVLCNDCKKESKNKCPICVKFVDQTQTGALATRYKELYEEIKFIGKGGFGEAHLVRLKQLIQNEFFIAKKINLSKYKNEKQKEGAKGEAVILKMLNSKYIVQYRE